MTNIQTANARQRRRMLPRAVLSLILILAMAAAWAVPALADTVYPKATDRIADDAALLSESTVREIKEKNETLISEVGAAIAVCTVKTTNGVDIGKYARSIYTEWKLPSGVLLLIASEDNAFYLVQSASISDKITNEDLEAIRDREIEEDFAAGNVDRAVRKAVSQLSILMLKELKPEEGEAGSAETAASESGTDASETPADKATAGSVILRILKTVLIIAAILLIAFIALFVAAMFNDDVGDFMRTYIFRRGGRSQNPGAYYDERLYNDNRNRQNQNRPRPNPNGQQHGAYPVQYPNQQGYPAQYPNQQGYPAQYPNQQGYPAQYPNQQGYPAQYPNQQGYPAQYPNQQGYPAQYPNQEGYPAQYPNQQGYPAQYPNQQGYPAQYPNQQGYPQYPNQQGTQTQYPGQQQAPRQSQTGGAVRRPTRPAQAQQPYSAEADPRIMR